MSEQAEALKQHVTAAYGVPENLKLALCAWIEVVEARVLHMHAVGEAPGPLTLAQRVTALEAMVTELHEALSNEPSPKTVQSAVGKVEPLGIVEEDHDPPVGIDESSR